MISFHLGHTVLNSNCYWRML